MLAYVFWHRPQDGVDLDAYEAAQCAFLETLDCPAACFRLDRLPFAEGPGYEDWYLVEGWDELGELNEAAVDTVHGPTHDRVAAMAGPGWGGVYRPARGAAGIPGGARWLAKERGRGSEEFLASLPSGSVWRRQLVLGPAPEFCLAEHESPGRVRIWPAGP